MAQASSEYHPIPALRSMLSLQNSSIGDLAPDGYQKGMKLNFVSQPLLQWGVCIVKISVGCALLRIATKKRWRWSIKGIMIFMVIYTAGSFTVSAKGSRRCDYPNIYRHPSLNANKSPCNGTLRFRESVGLPTPYRHWPLPTQHSTS